MMATPMTSTAKSTLWPFRYIRSHSYQVMNNLVGPILSNSLIFPLNGSKKFSDSTLRASHSVFSPIKDLSRPEKGLVLAEFRSIRQQHVEVQVGEKVYLLNITLFTSENSDNRPIHRTIRVGGNDEGEGNNFRVYSLLHSFTQLKDKKSITCAWEIINFTLYGHQVREDGIAKPWKAKEVQEIGSVFFKLLESLKPHSLICHSMGSVVFEGLPNIQHPFVPRIIIMERALPSFWKVSRQLYPTIVANLLYFAAYYSGWLADPEARILEYLKSLPADELKKVRLFLIEVIDDFYFSGNAAFDQAFVDDLQAQQVLVQRRLYEPNAMEAHPRANHALPLDRLIRFDDSKITSAAHEAIDFLLEEPSSLKGKEKSF